MATPFTTTEQTVFDALITHSSRREEVTLTELARECHVAKSTVIKTIKKLGFRGYREFANTYRLSSSVSADRLLPDQVVEGSFSETTEKLAECFWTCRSRKNIIYTCSEESIRPAAAYMSRKLGMFDIFAPVSYDRLLLDRVRLDPGFVIVLPRTETSDALGIEDIVAIMQAHIAEFRNKGFRSISISDSAALQQNLPVDVRINLAPSPLDAATGVDLFTPRLLVLFEHALSLFARHVAAEGTPLREAADGHDRP